MEELDTALERLGMLSTVTNARREFLNEMRLRGVRSQTSCTFPWSNKGMSRCVRFENQYDFLLSDLKFDTIFSL